ncbi:MAG TPA: DHA2 family efflux MFS transporter permease subunit [Candidatus Acidoferrales bacterium]|nr:DHA2 family efflux MFS transporter permease subunit [Candidatus Acidoferrales bacterium]
MKSKENASDTDHEISPNRAGTMAVEATTSAHAKPAINPWIIAISVMLATFLEVLDTTVVNVSLPHIAGSLSASVDESTWTLTSYLVANAIILPMTGWLSNYFGRKRMLLFSVTGFTVSSFLCGLAPSLGLLIFFRVIQGACGGGLQPISQAVLLESFKPEDRGKAMGFWGLGIVVAPMLGPVLGGWLTDSYSWRWVFYINVPIGIAAVIMTKLFIFDPPYIRRTSSRVDYWGIGMLALWVGGLQIVLDKGQEKDWFGTTWITVVTIVCVLIFIAFLAREFLTDTPVVNLRVFHNGTYSSGVFLMSLLGVGLYGTTVIIPLILQTLLGYPAVRAGLAMAPRGVGSFIAMPLIGIIMVKFDARRLLGIGLAVCAFTMWQFSHLNLNAGYWEFFWPQFIMGLSLGLIFVPLTTISMAPIAKEQMGNATSLFNLVRNIGGGFGISIVNSIQTRLQQGNIHALGAHVNATNVIASNAFMHLKGMFMSQNGDPVRSAEQAREMLFLMVQRQASMIAYNDVFRMLMWLFLFMLPFLLLMRRPERGAGGGMAH